jgi:serine/threonine protein kinase
VASFAHKQAVVGAGGGTAMLAKTEIAPPEPLSEGISEGAEIAGRYKILSLVGEGGMGAVYRARHLHLRKTFAVKVLQRRNVDRPDIVARFEREAIAAARIDHANVVPAIDFGRLPDGSFFLVMEFIDGRSLRAELKSGGAMPVARALGIMRGVVSGVRAAHANGIVHRDLKPENIMLVERDGNRDFVKLLDFGVARIGTEHSRDGGPKLTETGTMLGTPQYMSPEQILGRAVDVRSDLYSLGVVFFELLIGRCPFAGNLPALLEQHVTAPSPELPAALASKEPRIAEILGALLSKEPERRFQTAGELEVALAQVSRRKEQKKRARASRTSATGALIRGAGSFVRNLGPRMSTPLAKMTASMSRIGARGVSSIRGRLGPLFRRRRDWKVVSSARAAGMRAIEFGRAQWHLRPRAILVAACSLVAIGLVVLLLVASGSGKADRSEKRSDRSAVGNKSSSNRPRTPATR